MKSVSTSLGCFLLFTLVRIEVAAAFLVAHQHCGQATELDKVLIRSRISRSKLNHAGHSTVLESPDQHGSSFAISRRSILSKLVQTTTASGAACASSVLMFPVAPARAAKIDPDTAYANLRSAREELVTAGRNYFPKRNWEGLRDYLEDQATNMNQYEANAQALLESKRLDAESKKEIGTIRRYGVGADVIIMYGGLKGLLADEFPKGGEIDKYYLRTLDSLEEVITIVRSNKGFE